MDEEKQWACSACTYLNHYGMESCEICETQKPIEMNWIDVGQISKKDENKNILEEDEDHSVPIETARDIETGRTPVGEEEEDVLKDIGINGYQGNSGVSIQDNFVSITSTSLRART